jgi:hypothetical protein
MSMSAKRKRDVPRRPEATSTSVDPRVVETPTLTLEEAIGRRAYEIYLERGEGPGRELDDWLQAERELRIDAI